MVLGPTFLKDFTIAIKDTSTSPHNAWRGQLRNLSGQTKFKIKYYGQIQKSLITGTAFAPSLIFAIDPSTEEEILLFDGCKHGYNAMFCDTYKDDQINLRPVNAFFKNQGGEDTFEITVSVTYNNADLLEEEFWEQVDKNGMIELIDGSILEFETAKRNSFDSLQISAIDKKGHIFTVVSEELA
jgi:hypothetical protein